MYVCVSEREERERERDSESEKEKRERSYRVSLMAAGMDRLKSMR